MRRSVRTFGIAVTVTAAIPLCFTACTSTASQSLHATELAAAADSDLLDSPTEHLYQFSEMQVAETSAGSGTIAGGANSAAPGSDLAASPQVDAPAPKESAVGADSESTRLQSRGDDAGQTATPSGYMVLSDGVITAAELRVITDQGLEATFIMTSPTVLRRDDSVDTEVYAVGMLYFGDTEIPDSTLRLMPVRLDDESVEFDVSFALPESLLGTDPELPDEASVRLVFTADE